MYFRLQTAAREWFRDVRKDLSIDFDIYYLCLMAGLARRRKAEASQAATTDLTNDFPGVYRMKGRIITAFFLSQELKQLGISFTERSALHAAIRDLVDPLSSSHLSDQGIKEINKYSFGGFEVLTEYFQKRHIDRPRTLEAFLPMYKELINEAVAEQG